MEELTEERNGFKQSYEEARAALHKADENFAEGVFPADGLHKLGKLIRDKLTDSANKDIKEKVHDDLDKYVLP